MLATCFVRDGSCKVRRAQIVKPSDWQICVGGKPKLETHVSTSVGEGGGLHGWNRDPDHDKESQEKEKEIQTNRDL